VCALFDEMEREASDWLAREQVKPHERAFHAHIDARYEGQNFEVVVPMPEIDEGGLEDFLARFHAAHQREYGYDVAGKAVEIVNCRVQAVGRVRKAPLTEWAVHGSFEQARRGARSVYHGAAQGWVETPVYARTLLPAGATLAGPAVIDEMSSTTLLAPGQHASIDKVGNIVIELGVRSEA